MLNFLQILQGLPSADTDFLKYPFVFDNWADDVGAAELKENADVATNKNTIENFIFTV